MNRDFLKGLEGMTDAAVDAIMAEFGKDLQAEKERTAAAQRGLDEAKARIGELEKSGGEGAEAMKELSALKAKLEKEAEEARAKAADAQLSEMIRSVFPKERKIVNAYTEEALIAEVKEAMGKAENRGKGAAELFNALTKDREGIFANPNPPDMAPMGAGGGAASLSEARMRSVMGLKEKEK